jgi:REP element-mobilizing transposase RayT
VTFRLADSLPKEVLVRIGEKVQKHTERRNRKSKELEDYLDSGTGSCALKLTGIADIVARTLTQFDGVRYRLLAWCVMPNHVHVVVQPFGTSGLERILHGWKSYSAQMINRKLKRKGIFWQREYYDRLIRDGDELGRAIVYTAENPMKAKLREWKWVYVAKDWS